MERVEYKQDTRSTDDHILGHAPFRISNITFAPEPRYRTCFACGEYTHHAHIQWNGHNFICEYCIRLASEDQIV